MLRFITWSFQVNPSRHLSPFRPFSTFVDRLVNSHSFSPDAAVTVSSLIPPQAAGNVDSVITLLKAYSFPPAAMAAFITRYPSLASGLQPKILKPKLDFLSELGVSGGNLVSFLCYDGYHLSRRSLDNQYVPSINFLIGFLGGKSAVVSLLTSKRGSWVMRNCSDSTELNVSTLLAFGVPRSSIRKMLTLPMGPLARKPSEFRDVVAEISRFGFDPLSKMFIYGVATLVGMKRSKLETNVALLKQFGFSDDQAKVLFVKQPLLMGFSTKRIERGLKLFLEVWGWKVESLVDRPLLLMSSIERKIIPRKSIFSLLLSKDCVKKSDELSMLVISEDLFLRRYLMPHVSKVPQILDIYKNSKLQKLEQEPPKVVIAGDVDSGNRRTVEANAL